MMTDSNVIPFPGKFEGERQAVQRAYEKDLEGFGEESFGDVDSIGYWASVYDDESDDYVFFVINGDGFVTGTDEKTFRAMQAEYAEQCEQEESAQ